MFSSFGDDIYEIVLHHAGWRALLPPKTRYSPFLWSFIGLFPALFQQTVPAATWVAAATAILGLKEQQLLLHHGVAKKAKHDIVASWLVLWVGRRRLNLPKKMGFGPSPASFLYKMEGGGSPCLAPVPLEGLIGGAFVHVEGTD